MTPTPHLHALAMRTKAAEAVKHWHDNRYGKHSHAAQPLLNVHAAILALPLAAENAALIREAARLIIAKWDADTASGIVYGPNEFAVLVRALALETP